MKIKQGFISNSSSTSFILGFNDPDDLSVTVTWKRIVDVKEPMIVESVKSNFDISKIGTVIRSIDELKSYIIEKHKWRSINTLREIFKDDPDVVDEYRTLRKTLKKNKAIIIGNLGDNCKGNESLLCYGLNNHKIEFKGDIINIGYR